MKIREGWYSNRPGFVGGGSIHGNQFLGIHDSNAITTKDQRFKN
jgi:hypothetical protein